MGVTQLLKKPGMWKQVGQLSPSCIKNKQKLERHSENGISKCLGTIKIESIALWQKSTKSNGIIRQGRMEELEKCFS